MKTIHSDYALKLIDQLTLEEKIALSQGHNFMYTNSVPRLNIPSIRMSDGPHGLRVQDNENASGVAGNASSTAFPTLQLHPIVGVLLNQLKNILNNYWNY